MEQRSNSLSKKHVGLGVKVLIMVMLLGVFRVGSYYLSQVHGQHLSSRFVTVSNVKLVDYYSDLSGSTEPNYYFLDYLGNHYGGYRLHGRRHRDTNPDVAYGYVDFTLHGKRYHNMLISGFNQIDSKRTNNAKDLLWNPSVSYLNYVDQPYTLKHILVFRHEKRISHGSYALQVNRNTPKLSWQLSHHQVCLVGNL